jgi:hypothetical protein
MQMRKVLQRILIAFVLTFSLSSSSDARAEETFVLNGSNLFRTPNHRTGRPSFEIDSINFANCPPPSPFGGPLGDPICALSGNTLVLTRGNFYFNNLLHSESDRRQRDRPSGRFLFYLR